jgi:hypothetical protein
MGNGSFESSTSTNEETESLAEAISKAQRGVYNSFPADHNLEKIDSNVQKVRADGLNCKILPLVVDRHELTLNRSKASPR